MKSTRQLACCVLLVLLLFPAVSGGDEPIFSGPQAGETLPPLAVEIAYSRQSPDLVDFVEQAGPRPAMLVFVNGANRPAARLTRVLLNYAEMQPRDRLFAATIWLSDDRSAAHHYLQQAISWWGNGLPVGISPDGGEGPGAYGLNRNVNVTVLVAENGRVMANFALVQPSETDALKILAEASRLTGGSVPTTPEVVFLSLPTRKLDTANGAVAPADAEFRKLICNLLAASVEQSAAVAAEALIAYVGDDAQRQLQLQHVAEALTGGRTKIDAIPATQYLRRWREAAREGSKPTTR